MVGYHNVKMGRHKVIKRASVTQAASTSNDYSFEYSPPGTLVERLHTGETAYHQALNTENLSNHHFLLSSYECFAPLPLMPQNTVANSVHQAEQFGLLPSSRFQASIFTLFPSSSSMLRVLSALHRLPEVTENSSPKPTPVSE
ncbi:hypothetical protein NP233_g8023 [Leucocoprinus birnbaumii]|uniref:Uncharacterized protein n=1 Tax=Leucocoprinus birnbaumii TaxID=56174 RepID=A0AAD5YU77_9AGAR|nr:hypothetical protein NP233_g8023 [Leucocoprinus birnbaumii]